MRTDDKVLKSVVPHGRISYKSIYNFWVEFWISLRQFGLKRRLKNLLIGMLFIRNKHCDKLW